jgi:hypothetical protein
VCFFGVSIAKLVTGLNMHEYLTLVKNGQSIENGVTNTEYLERNEGAIKNGQSIENGKIGNTRQTKQIRQQKKLKQD